jgi:hypothetical protein
MKTFTLYLCIAVLLCGVSLVSITVTADGSTYTSNNEFKAENSSSAAAPTVQFSSAIFTASEGSFTNITVTLSSVHTSAVTVNYATGGGTAAPGMCFNDEEREIDSDYQEESGTLTFAPGETSKTFEIQTCHEDFYDGANDTVGLTLSSPVNASLGSTVTATLTITDDDSRPTIYIGGSPTVSVVEGETFLKFDIHRGGASDNEIGVEVNTSEIDATPTDSEFCSSDSDYVANSAFFKFAPGETRKIFIVELCGDNIDEDDEIFDVSIDFVSSPATLGAQNFVRVKILDNDTAGVLITPTGGSTDVAEGGATDTYSVVLTSEIWFDVIVTINPSSPAQVSTSPVKLTFDFDNWNIPQTVTVTAVDDNISEGNHTSVITHSVTSREEEYDGVSAPSVTVNITDNEPPNTPIGSTTVQSSSGDARVTFTNVRTEGTTIFTPINPPSSAGTPPQGYTILGSGPAYNITTTAAYDAPVTVCFVVSSITSETEFSRVRILHGENGLLVNRTILAPDTPAPNFATRTVCARVSSLSPFVAALAPVAPTAANVSVTGRVITGSGRGIRNVTVTMIDSQGGERTAQTTSFGYYRFDDVTAGETITITAKARRYKFNQSSIVRTTNDSVIDADFVSEQ